MTHPTHHWIAKRYYGAKFGCGFVAEDASSLDDCVDGLIDTFSGNHVDVQPSLGTVLVLEIDGAVAMDRTEDALKKMIERYADTPDSDLPFALTDLRRAA